MADKLTTEELEKVKAVYGVYMEHDRKVHEFNLLHSRAKQMLFKAEDELNAVRAELEEKYGSVNINLETGEMQKVEEQPEVVEPEVVE